MEFEKVLHNFMGYFSLPNYSIVGVHFYVIMHSMNIADKLKKRENLQEEEKELNKEIEKVVGSIKNRISEKGLSIPSENWILTKIKEYKDAWNSSSNTAVIEDIVDDWKEEASKKHSDEHNDLKIDNLEGEKFLSGMKQSLEIAQKVQPIAEKFRQEFWGKPNAPFVDIDKAIDWLQKLQEKEEALYGKWERGSLTFTLNLPIHMNNTNEEFYEKLSELKDSKSKDIKAWFNLFEDRLIRGEINGYEFYEKFLEFKVYSSNDKLHNFLIPLGGQIEKLYKKCEEVVRETEWWNLNQALRFILCNKIPYAGIQVKKILSRVKTFNNPSLTSIEMKILAPISEEELVSAYRDALDDFNIKPKLKKLSYAHAMLLLLVSVMPIKPYTWTDRLKLWLEWHKSSSRAKDMPTYNAKLMPDSTITNKKKASNNLRNEYNRAKAKAQNLCWETEKLPNTLPTKKN